MSLSADGSQVRLVKVAVISPSDVTAERDVVETVVGELNRELASGPPYCMIRLWRWEKDVLPGLHVRGPQGLIDELMDIAHADIVVAIFWTRLGTPTQDARSGTEHELKRAWAAWKERGRPEVLVYFCERAHNPRSGELAQWHQVRQLRAEIFEHQMYAPYREVVEFERLVREHLRRAIRSIQGPAPHGEMSRGMNLLLGSVRLRIEGSDAAFEVAGDQSKVYEVSLPGAVIGTAAEADVHVVGAAADGKVSRFHLVVRSSGHQWVITDCKSTNGTHEVDAERGVWRAIPTDVPVPIEDGMLLRLGPDLVLRCELCVPARAGDQTPRLGGPASRQQRIRPAPLEQLAIVLLERRRADPVDRSLPSVADLAGALSLEPKAVKRQLRDLRGLRAVASCLAGKRSEQLADALEIAFPYLVAMPPGIDSRATLADRDVRPPRTPIA